MRYGTTSGKYSAAIDVGFVQQYSVAGLVDGTSYCFAVQAYDRAGTRSALSAEVCGNTAGEAPSDGGGEPLPGDGALGDVVLYASKAGVIKGNWIAGASTGAAGGRAIRSEDRGWSAPNAPLAAPSSYFEMTFPAAANTPYKVWLRLRAANNSKWNDAVWVQFSDALVSGSAKYRIGTTSALLVNLEPCEACGTSGWGWQNKGYWLNQPTTVTFASSGTHTIRVQIREDGVEIDQILLSPMKYLSTAPGPAKGDATILPETGTASATPSASEIVMHASDASNTRGNWARAAITSAAGGQAMRSVDRAWSSPDRPLSAPEHYFDLTFSAPANTQYRVWLRLRAAGNSKWNDAVWVQFSDSLVSGSPKYRTGTTEGLLVNLERCEGCGVSGWGWQNSAYWLNQGTIVTFASSGTHRLRVQTREDGVEIDQVVLSAVKYKSVAPGSATNDATILAKSTVSTVSTVSTTTSPIAAATLTPYDGTPLAIPGLIEAAHFDEGEAGVAYSDTTPGNTGGVFRTTDVDLQTSSLGGYNIAWTAAGEWVTYTANVQSAGTYYAKLKVASRGGGALQIAAGAPSNSARDVAIPDTRDGQTWTTVTVPLTLASGTQIFTVRFLTGNVSLHSISLMK